MTATYPAGGTALDGFKLLKIFIIMWHPNWTSVLHHWKNKGTKE